MNFKMKKYMLFGGVMLAMVGLSSCDDSFADWAAPSTNEPEAALAAYGIEINGSGVEVDMNDANRPDSIKIASLSAASTDITSLAFDNITVNGCTIPYAIKGSEAYVGTYALDSLARIALRSQKCEKRALKVNVDAHAILKTGEALAFTTELTQNETPVTTPSIDPNGYYLLGDLSGNGWTPSNGIWMAEESEGVFTAKVETTGDSNWFKFYGGTGFSADNNWDLVNQYQYGCDVNGDGATFNFINWSDVQTPIISGAGKWKITLDVNNWTFSVDPVFADLYMTGSKYNWGSTWVPMTPIYGSDEDFWTIAYFDTDEMIKFAPQADWGNDFGGNADVINDVAGAGAVNDGSNLKFANAGWYLLHVVNGATRKVEILNPDVYLIGNTAGGWDITDANKFTVPTTADGEFVSNAFVASDELRMCIKIDGFDWWMTEFMIFDGKIDFRGRGGDQARVSVTAGQKAYLNFKNGTGDIK